MITVELSEIDPFNRGRLRIGTNEYSAARCEHAWLLRSEGLSFRAIGKRLGCSGNRAMKMVNQFACKVMWAMRYSRLKVYHTQEGSSYADTL